MFSLFFVLMFLILLSTPSVQKYKNLLPDGIFSCTTNLNRLYVQILCNPILSSYILEWRKYHKNISCISFCFTGPFLLREYLHMHVQCNDQSMYHLKDLSTQLESKFQKRHALVMVMTLH